MNERFPGWFENPPSLIDRQDFHTFRDELDRIYERLRYSPQAEMDNSTMDSMFNLKPDTKPFLKWVGCARTWTDSIDCGNLTQIDSVQNRRCTTILHRGSMLNDLVNRPELFNSTGDTPEEESYSYFDAKEVIKLVVDFEPEDYADLKRQIGARIIFHDNAHVAPSTSLDFFITRGFRYDFNIDRRDTVPIGRPYGRCWDYDANNLDKYKHRIDPRVPLTSNTCYQNCVIRNIIHRANCWPPVVPYFRNDSLDPDLKIKGCNWFKGSHHVSIFNELSRLDDLRMRKKQRLNNTAGLDSTTASTTSTTTKAPKRPYNERMKTYMKIRRFCWAQCILNCRLVTYSVTVTRSVWPPDVKVLFDKTGKERLMRHCCALVAIKFAHFHYNVQEYKPKYYLENTIGDLGGLLAVWIGISIVSVYNAIQKLIELCNRRSLARVHTLAKFRASPKHLEVITMRN